MMPLPIPSVSPADFMLIVLGASAAVSDYRSRRVPNVLVACGAAIGVFLAASKLGGAGLLAALAGAGVGLGLMFPFFAAGALGAGDVKLMAMMGVFAGFEGVLRIAFYSALAGGVLALLMLAATRGQSRRVPYALAMLCGAAAWVVGR